MLRRRRPVLISGRPFKRSGSTRGSPAARLSKPQDHTDNIENEAKSDGVVSKKERQRIPNAHDRASRNIYREKHDRQGARHLAWVLVPRWFS